MDNRLARWLFAMWLGWTSAPMMDMSRSLTRAPQPYFDMINHSRGSSQLFDVSAFSLGSEERTV